jgi:hypothetical protein
VSIQGRIVGDTIEADDADSVCEHHRRLCRGRWPYPGWGRALPRGHHPRPTRGR